MGILYGSVRVGGNVSFTSPTGPLDFVNQIVGGFIAQ